MKIGPPTKMANRAVALLYPGHRRLEAHTVDGLRVANGKRQCEELLTSISGHCIYVPGALTSLRHTTGALGWSCDTWRGRETRMNHAGSGCSVSSLRGTLEGSDDPFGDLLRVLGWVRGYGVGPASITSMAWSLWRASLSHKVTLWFDPEIGRKALYGGRQEVAHNETGEPRIYRQMVAVDMRAAYPHSMAERDYALSLRPVSVDTHLDPTVPGIARATVYLDPDLPYGPLPWRVDTGMIMFPNRGRVEGVWPWVELAAARELGCEVKVSECWAPARTQDLFGAWWPMVQSGRDLPGTSGVVAKAIANSLWGHFGMVGEDRTTKRWTDDRGNTAYEVDEPERDLPHRWTAHIAAEPTSRVRSRLLLEGLYGGGAGRPVHVDTDGIIVRGTSPLPPRSGSGPGEWRVKARMPKVDIRAPQLYRWTCGEGCGVTHPEWHYSASGMPAASAPEYFRRSAGFTHISYLASFDATLPAEHLDDQAKIARLILEARSRGVL